MSVAGNMKTKRAFGPQLPGGILAPFPYFYRDFYNSETEEECAQRCLENLDRIIDSTSTGDVGAVITEPYQGGAGFIFPPAGWLKGLEAWAREREMVFILDEVQSSFGRTGKLFALEWEGPAAEYGLSRQGHRQRNAGVRACRRERHFRVHGGG